MKERPILFSGAMVRAILSGQKTVTRRIVKPQYAGGPWSVRPAANPRHERHSHDWWLPDGSQPYSALPHCHYGQPGDRLWVRESFADLRGTGIEHRPDPAGPLQRYAFAADSPPGSASDEARKDFGVKWKPSIHMPRAACRILLEITDVRVERLRDISEQQARAEGIEPYPGNPGRWISSHRPGLNFPSAGAAFRNLWESINGEGSWAANPWVWVVEFKQVTP